MRMLKTFSLFFVCLSLLFGNVANAAMSCCESKGKTTEVKIESSKTEMPCHKASGQQAKKSNDLNNCNDCKHCTSIASITAPQPVYPLTFKHIIHNIPGNSFISFVSEGIYFPPKAIS